MIIGSNGSAQADIIFVIEGTAINGAYLNDLKTNYLMPALEFFSQGNIEDRDYVCESTSTLYGLVVYHAADILPKPSSDCYGPYSSPQRLLTTLDKLELIGGKGESHANIAEGLATALQAFEDLQQKREGTNIMTQKHCILVCNSPPYQMPVMESPSFVGHSLDQLASILNEQNINLSILSPRKIPAIFKLFEKAGGDLTQSQNKNYAKDPRHLVLLKGFSLKERPISPIPGANNNIPVPSLPSPIPNDGSPMTAVNQMSQQTQLTAPPPGYRPPQQPPQVIGQSPQPQQQQQTQPTQIPGRPNFQNAGPPGYPGIRGQGNRWPMPPPGSIPQQRNYMSSQTGPVQGSALIAQLTQPPSAQFPNHRLDGPVLGTQMIPQQQAQLRMSAMGINPQGQMGPGGGIGLPLGSQGVMQGMGPQNPLTQQQNMNQGVMGPAGGMIPPGLMNQNVQNQGPTMSGPGLQGPMGNAMQGNPGAQQAFQGPQVLGPGGNAGLGMTGAGPNQSMQGPVSQNQNPGQQQQQNASQQQPPQQQQQQQPPQQQQPLAQPASTQQSQQQPPSTPQPQQPSQQSQSQQQQQSQQPLPGQTPGSAVAQPPGPGAPNTGVTVRERHTIWQGILEWIEKGKNPADNQKITKHVPCQISSTPKEGEPDLKADSWPPKLIMQLMPKQLIGSIGGAYLKNSTSVLFHPQPCEALESLTKVMTNGFAGCVHFTSMPNQAACDIKVLILLYTAEKKAYLGFIPNDQVAFVDRLRKVIQHQKTNQQQAMIRQGQVGGVPNQSGPNAAIPTSNPGTTQGGIMMSQTNTMAMGGGQITQAQDGIVPNVQGMQGVQGIQGLGQNPGQGRGGPMLGAPQQPPMNHIEAARQQNLAKIQQLQQTLQQAQQQEIQYKSQLEIISQLKIQQLQQNLEQAQQQEVHYQAQMEQEQKQQLRAQLQQMQQRQMTPQQIQQQQQQPVGNPQQPPNQQQQVQQRMMRPQLTGNPGLRHLLQQQQQPAFRQHVMGMGQMPQRPGGAQPPNQGNQQFEDVSNFDFMN